MEGEWETTGRPAVQAEIQKWTRGLEAGAPYRQLLQVERIWPPRPETDTFADAAAAEGNLIMTPAWFGGKIHVLEFDGLVYVGRGVRMGEPSLKEVATHVSSHMKALADPTRLAILLRLARDSASVTELARQLNLSQPTVSAHVQVLREAMRRGYKDVRFIRDDRIIDVLRDREDFQQLLAELQAPDFGGVAFSLTVWGQKP